MFSPSTSQENWTQVDLGSRNPPSLTWPVKTFCWNPSGSSGSCPGLLLGSCTKRYTFLYDNLVLADWLYNVWASRPKFSSVPKGLKGFGWLPLRIPWVRNLGRTASSEENWVRTRGQSLQFGIKDSERHLGTCSQRRAYKTNHSDWWWEMLIYTLNYLPKKAQGVLEMASDAALSVQLVQRIDCFSSLVRMDDVKLSSYGPKRSRSY